MTKKEINDERQLMIQKLQHSNKDYYIILKELMEIQNKKKMLKKSKKTTKVVEKSFRMAMDLQDDSFINDVPPTAASQVKDEQFMAMSKIAEKPSKSMIKQSPISFLDQQKYQSSIDHPSHQDQSPKYDINYQMKNTSPSPQPYIFPQYNKIQQPPLKQIHIKYQPQIIHQYQKDIQQYVLQQQPKPQDNHLELAQQLKNQQQNAFTINEQSKKIKEQNELIDEKLTINIVKKNVKKKQKIHPTNTKNPNNNPIKFNDIIQQSIFKIQEQIIIEQPVYSIPTNLQEQNPIKKPETDYQQYYDIINEQKQKNNDKQQEPFSNFPQEQPISEIYDVLYGTQFNAEEHFSEQKKWQQQQKENEIRDENASGMQWGNLNDTQPKQQYPNHQQYGIQQQIINKQEPFDLAKQQIQTPQIKQHEGQQEDIKQIQKQQQKEEVKIEQIIIDHMTNIKQLQKEKSKTKKSGKKNKSKVVSKQIKINTVEMDLLEDELNQRPMKQQLQQQELQNEKDNKQQNEKLGEKTNSQCKINVINNVDIDIIPNIQSDINKTENKNEYIQQQQHKQIAEIPTPQIIQQPKHQQQQQQVDISSQFSQLKISNIKPSNESKLKKKKKKDKIITQIQKNNLNDIIIQENIEINQIINPQKEIQSQNIVDQLKSRQQQNQKKYQQQSKYQQESQQKSQNIELPSNQKCNNENINQRNEKQSTLTNNNQSNDICQQQANQQRQTDFIKQTDYLSEQQQKPTPNIPFHIETNKIQKPQQISQKDVSNLDYTKQHSNDQQLNTKYQFQTLKTQNLSLTQTLQNFSQIESKIVMQYKKKKLMVNKTANKTTKKNKINKINMLSGQNDLDTLILVDDTSSQQKKDEQIQINPVKQQKYENKKYDIFQMSSQQISQSISKQQQQNLQKKNFEDEFDNNNMILESKNVQYHSQERKEDQKIKKEYQQKIEQVRIETPINYNELDNVYQIKNQEIKKSEIQQFNPTQFEKQIINPITQDKSNIKQQKVQQNDQQFLQTKIKFNIKTNKTTKKKPKKTNQTTKTIKPLTNNEFQIIQLQIQKHSEIPNSTQNNKQSNAIMMEMKYEEKQPNQQEINKQKIFTIEKEEERVKQTINQQKQNKYNINEKEDESNLIYNQPQYIDHPVQLIPKSDRQHEQYLACTLQPDQKPKNEQQQTPQPTTLTQQLLFDNTSQTFHTKITKTTKKEKLHENKNKQEKKQKNKIIKGINQLNIFEEYIEKGENFETNQYQQKIETTTKQPVTCKEAPSIRQETINKIQEIEVPKSEEAHKQVQHQHMEKNQKILTQTSQNLVDEIVLIVREVNKRHLNAMKQRFNMMKEDMRSILIETHLRQTKQSSKPLQQVHYEYIIAENIDLKQRLMKQ